MASQPISLVLLPGLDGTGLVFEPLLKALPKTIDPQVVRYPADKPLSFQEHVDFARQQLPAGKKFVLLAESFSGPIGLQLLADPPGNMVGAIFVATFDRYPRPFLLDAIQYLPQKLLLTLFTTTPLGRFFCLGSASSAALKVFRSAIRSVSQEAISRRLQILRTLPPPPEVSNSLPCLYLQASHDRLVPDRALKYLQRQLPQLQAQRLNGPHIVLLAQPEAGAKAIDDFISQLAEAI